ncbi:MAG: hypothetical protein JNN12_10815 [Bacteroidetes Order II. Incertae sedis bacterium]|nr:hypothetical protein [Bacteroidetes Order II. bacterium]
MLTRRIFLLLVFSVFGASVSMAQQTKLYANARFNYSIKYPAAMIADPPPTNGDGQSYRSADGLAEYTTWGSVVIRTDTVLQEQLFMASEGRRVTLKRVKPTFIVVSGYQDDGRIFYRKTILVKANTVPGMTYDYIKSFEIVYPANQRTPYDKIVTEIAHAFVK